MKSKNVAPVVTEDELRKQAIAKRLKDRPLSGDLYREEGSRVQQQVSEASKENVDQNSKVTRAILLRDKNNEAKLRSEEEKKLELVEQHLRTSTDFREWQAKMRAMDEEARLTAVEVKKKELEELFAKMQKSVEERLQTNKRMAARSRVDSTSRSLSTSDRRTSTRGSLSRTQ